MQQTFMYRAGAFTPEELASIEAEIVAGAVTGELPADAQDRAYRVFQKWQMKKAPKVPSSDLALAVDIADAAMTSEVNASADLSEKAEQLHSAHPETDATPEEILDAIGATRTG